ncbi:MAG TPA: glycosyltransferase family 2 protein [Flavipsychrobacter sp.]|nr:glycosyltransferase family 2 protein [Flavipsychrobacter sp.]
MPDVSRPLISVVIVSWNVKELSINCVDSILKSTILDKIEVVVVDNASSDGTVTAMKDKFGALQNVQIYASTINHGFAKGNNIGFELARGQYTFILNPDTLVLPDTIEKLYLALTSDNSIGMTGPKLLYENGTVQKTCARKLPGLNDTILAECFKVQSWPRFFSNYFEYKVRFPYNYANSQLVTAISGAAMLMKTEDLKAIGMFDPEYLHCGEDIELCWKVLRAGKRIRYCEEATVIHFESQSSKKVAVRTQVNALISIGRYIKKTKGILSYLIYRFSILFVKVPVESLIVFLLFFRNRFKSTEDTKNRGLVILKIINWKPILANRNK